MSILSSLLESVFGCSKGRNAVRRAIAPVLMQPLESRQHLTATYQVSWIGNSFPGTNTTWVQSHIQDAFVSPQGTVYAVTDYEEAHMALAAYSGGRQVSTNLNYHNKTNKAITSDGTYVYAATRNSTTAYYVSRFNTSLADADFTGGVFGGNSVLASNVGEVRGLVTGGGKLFATVPSESKVVVWDTASLSTAPTSFSFTNGRKLAYDNNGFLWIVQRDSSTSATVKKFSTSGVYQGSQYDITGLINASEISVDHQGRLLIADSDPSRNNIRIYDLSGTPSLVGTFGDAGGFYPTGASNPGIKTPTRFDGIMGAGTDSSGNYYVVTDGDASDWYDDGLGTRIVSVTPGGTQNWELIARTFVENTVFDPADPTKVYNMKDRFDFNFSNTSGKEATWVSSTYDRSLSQADLRPNKHATIGQITYINGQKFMLVGSQYQDQITLYRFIGEQAIPCVIINSKTWGSGDTRYPVNAPNGKYIWRDGANLSGTGAILDGVAQPAEFIQTNVKAEWNPWFIDSVGNLWQGANGSGKVLSQPISGLDSNGVPIYDPALASYSATLSTFNKMRQARYDPSTDTMWISGWTTGNPQPTSDTWWVYAGSELAKYTNWSTTRTLAWQTVFPDGDTTTYPGTVGLAWAKDYLFVSEFVSKDVLVYNANTGAYVTTLVADSELGQLGNPDTPYAVGAVYKADTDEYLVTVEDDGSSKTVLYRVNFDAPKAPVGMTSVAGNGNVTFAWQRMVGESYYNVYRSTIPGGQGGVPYRTGLRDAWFVDSNVQNGITYYYRFATVSDMGEGAKGPEYVMTPSSAAPTVSMTPSDGATYVGTVGSLKFVATATPSAGRTISKVLFYSSGSLVSTDTSAPFEYEFRNVAGNNNRDVIAVAYDNTGAATSVARHVIINSSTLTAPTNVAVTPGTRQASITWAASAGATSYTVRRSDVLDGLYTVIASGLTTLTYTDTGLLDGTTYFYRVQAYNGATGSAQSMQISGTTTFPAPTALSAATISSSQINLNWTDNSNSESAFVIERATDSAFTQAVTTVATTLSGATTFADTGLSASTTYYYRVRAVNAYGESSHSTTATATTSSGALFTDNFSSGLGNWTPVGGSWAALASRNGRNDLYRQSNTTATVGVFSVAGSSAWTDYSVSAWVNTQTAVSTGSIGIVGRYVDSSNYYSLILSNNQDWKIFKVVAGTTTVIASGSLSWTTNTWYNLRLTMLGTTLTAEVSADGSNYTALGSVADSAHASGKIGVRTYLKEGAFDDVLVTAVSAPSAPSGLSATAVSSSQINVSWNDNSNNETGFLIERATNSSFTQNLATVATTLPNVTSYNNTGLGSGTTYYYRVRAVGTYGQSANSGISSAMTASGTLFSDSFDSGLTNWTPANGTWAALSSRDGRSDLYRQSNTTTNLGMVSAAGSSAWTDYRVSAWLNTQTAVNTGSIGIVGRYVDSSNYYSLILSNNQDWKIFKVVAGTTTVIASGSLSWTTNTWYNLRLTLSGSNLSAEFSTDGTNYTALGSVTDSAHSAGKVGVRTYLKEGAFDDVLVTSL